METDVSKAGSGLLTVKVTTGNGAFPIEGATVYVSEYKEGTPILYSLRSDRNGLTPTVVLPTPSRIESLSPGNNLPYSEYLVFVKKDGYYMNENIGVPVFDGITSVQSVQLLPLTEMDLLSGITPSRIYFENDGYKNLRGLTETERSVKNER